MPLGHTVTPAVQAPSNLCPWETRPESEKHCRGARTPERRPPWLLEVPLRTRTSRYVPAGESAHQVRGLHESGREAVQEKLAGGLRAPSKLPGTKTGNPREPWRAAHTTTLKAWRRTLACQRQGAASPLTLQAARALATSATVRSPCATSSTGRPLTRTLLAVETHPEVGNSHKPG